MALRTSSAAESSTAAIAIKSQDGAVRQISSNI